MIFYLQSNKPGTIGGNSMSNKKLLYFLGTALIVSQALSLIGMLRMYVGLYPDDKDVLSFPYMSMLGAGGITIRKLLFAISAGIERFFTGLEDLFYDKYEYRAMTSTQITSAMIRYSLKWELGGIGLFIYDAILHYPSQKVRGKLVRAIEREFYKDELKRILDTQMQFHAELRDKELYNSCLDVLYQRKIELFP